jgi:hypothetical protein
VVCLASQRAVSACHGMAMVATLQHAVGLARTGFPLEQVSSAVSFYLWGNHGGKRAAGTSGRGRRAGQARSDRLRGKVASEGRLLALGRLGVGLAYYSAHYATRPVTRIAVSRIPSYPWQNSSNSCPRGWWHWQLTTADNCWPQAHLQHEDSRLYQQDSRIIAKAC